MLNAPKLALVTLALSFAGLIVAESADVAAAPLRQPNVAVVEACRTSATWHVPSASQKKF